MRFLQTKFNGALELSGQIEFPLNKVVVLYGANLQGKTNIINAIRYAFLKEIEKRGRKRIQYDDWALPAREEMVSDGEAEVDVIFEHAGAYYKLNRRISAGGRRDTPTLSRLSGWPGKEIESVDVEPFVKERLKAGLLDALFAPEIAGGFKRLYGRDIDEAISEVFKEVVSARHLSQRFIERLGGMKSKTQAEMARIKEDYCAYCQRLLRESKELLKFSEFSDFQTFEVGKIFAKITRLFTAVEARIKSLEKDELFEQVRNALGKAENLSILREKFSDEKKIKNTLEVIKNTISDREMLRRLLSALQKVSTVEDEMPKPPTFHNVNLNGKVKEIYEKLREAKSSHQKAKGCAEKHQVGLETLKDSIKGIGYVVLILKKRRKIGLEKQASVTKVGKKAYAVIPMKTLIKDPTFATLSDQPIPKGSIREREQYLGILGKKHEELSEALRAEKKSQRKFKEFKDMDLEGLSSDERGLEEKAKSLKRDVEDWAKEVITRFSAFVGIHGKVWEIETEKDVDGLLSYAAGKADAKEGEYLKSLNEKLNPLDIVVKTFEEKEMRKIQIELERQRKELPAYREVAKSLENNKEAWRGNDEVYADYSIVPTMVDETLPILNAIINESVDEQKLKVEIATTYNEIIDRMKERKLIKAVAEMSKEGIRAQVKYKDRLITHPGGAEKAFFSLAILTALGHYFRMPILIDEVANNLDSKNLRAFFYLVTELKSEKQLQYVLSVKETRDFDMDGWVKDIADDVVVYKLDEKNIQRIM